MGLRWVKDTHGQPWSSRSELPEASTGPLIQCGANGQKIPTGQPGSSQSILPEASTCLHGTLWGRVVAYQYDEVV